MEIDWKATADTLIAERNEKANAPRNLYTCAELARIRDIVAALVGIEVADMIGPCKHDLAVFARSIHAGVSKAITTSSFPDIAESLGRSAHSTSMRAYERWEQMPQHERDAIVAEIRRRIA